MPDVSIEDQRFRQLVSTQWGVVTLAQLGAAGWSEGAVAHAQRRGRLARLHRGVYAVGHDALRWEGRLLAAVLACGDGAALSFLSAAAWHELHPSRGVLIDVSVPRQRRRRRGIRVHLVGDLEADITEERGIRVTSPTRTLIDLATVLPLAALERVAARAEHRGLIDHARLGAAQCPELRAIFGDGTPQVIRGDDEDRFERAVRAAGLPRPEMNVWLTHGNGEEWQVDALWLAQRVIVELVDDTHLTRFAFEEDRRKDAARQTDGYRTLRFTRRRLREDPASVVATVARLLNG